MKRKLVAAALFIVFLGLASFIIKDKFFVNHDLQQSATGQDKSHGSLSTNTSQDTQSNSGNNNSQAGTSAGSDTNQKDGSQAAGTQGTDNQGNGTQQDSGTNKDANTAPEVKPDSAYAEEAVMNFSMLYPSTVNKGKTVDYLKSVVFDDSAFYKSIGTQLEQLRQKGATISFTSFDITDITYKGNSIFDIKVSQVMEVKYGSKVENNASTVIYSVKSTKDKTAIIDSTTVK